MVCGIINKKHAQEVLWRRQAIFLTELSIFFT